MYHTFLYSQEQDTTFRYIALELCQATLHEVSVSTVTIPSIGYNIVIPFHVHLYTMKLSLNK